MAVKEEEKVDPKNWCEIKAEHRVCLIRSVPHGHPVVIRGFEKMAVWAFSLIPEIGYHCLELALDLKPTQFSLVPRGNQCPLRFCVQRSPEAQFQRSTARTGVEGSFGVLLTLLSSLRSKGT